MRQSLDENIPFRWLSGGLRPDHRTLSDFRKNNLVLLPGLFVQNHPDCKRFGLCIGWTCQFAVDSDYGMIVGIKMNNCSNDQKQFEGVLESIEQTTGQLPQKVTADAGYFSADNIQIVETLKVDAYISATRESKQAQNPYDKANFAYQTETDTYICPAGKILKVKQVVHADNPAKPTEWIYECKECRQCPFQKDCTKSKSGKRTVKRTEADPIREAMRTKVQSNEGKAIYRRRKGLVEPS